MENKYKTLFQKCVQAQGDKHSAAAMLFANECTKVRKMARAIVVSQLTLERLVFNLDTIQDYWSVVAEFKPIRSTLQVLSGRLADFLPETAHQLKQLGETLSNIADEFDDTLY
jgi:division protein CdvB (Snf7/Vps24/ESCRT-III family)